MSSPVSQKDPQLASSLIQKRAIDALRAEAKWAYGWLALFSASTPLAVLLGAAALGDAQDRLARARTDANLQQVVDVTAGILSYSVTVLTVCTGLALYAMLKSRAARQLEQLKVKEREE